MSFPISKVISAGLIFLVFFSCKTSPVQQEETVSAVPKDTVYYDTVIGPPEPPPAPIVYSVDTFLNDYASLVSGLPADKYFGHFYLDSSYMRLERRSGREWNYMMENKINNMRAWSDTVVAPSSEAKALFYPFAGADFLHVDPLFHNVNRYVMVGLEPLGTVIADTGNKRVLKSHADKIYRSLYFSNRLGFFRTLSMRAELNQKELNGALPLLLFYIRRFGYSISSLEYFDLDSTGNVLQSDPASAIGLKIKFHDFKGPIRELDYFRFDLSDDGLQRDDRLIRYVSKMEPYGVYLKAASYLMHNSSFSSIRGTILNKALFVLQDDSGIPLSSFEEGAWERQLWGKYTRTISLFRGRYQSSLASAYKQGPSLPLNFYIGYNISHKECNMMWFRKSISINTTQSNNQGANQS
ncbi:MAG: hypothetical protein ACKOYC_04280, partial [Bacteroidota bacterium]